MSRTLPVGTMAFVVLFGYALARPATESLFLEAYGSAALPKAWIGVAIAMLVVVAVYNAAAARFELRSLMLGSIVVSACGLGVLLALRNTGAWATFALYMWKDVHVVVLLECLWSFANLVFTRETARWSYGLFCAAGSMGGMCGNFSVGSLAKAWGTQAPLYLLLVVFVLDAVAAMWLAHATGRPRPPSRQRIRLGDALALLRSSDYLPHLLVLIGVVQLSVNLIDYEFNTVLERAYPEVDARTAVIGHVYGAIDGGSLALQLATGLVLRAAGLRGTLLGIPLLIGAALGWFALAPAFLSIAIVKVASKVLDYSLFRAAKEMLYIPLGYEEKTRGKALVDMLTYRVAKGGASLLLAVAVPFGAVGIITGALLLSWLGISGALLVRYRRRLSGSEG